jgi:hypothetical protein
MAHAWPSSLSRVPPVVLRCSSNLIAAFFEKCPEFNDFQIIAVKALVLKAVEVC